MRFSIFVEFLVNLSFPLELQNNVLVQKHAWLVIVLNHAVTLITCRHTSHSHCLVVKFGLVHPRVSHLTVLFSSNTVSQGQRSFGLSLFVHVSCSAETLIFQHRPVSFVYKNLSYMERHHLLIHDYNYNFQDISNFSLGQLFPTFPEIC